MRLAPAPIAFLCLAACAQAADLPYIHPLFSEHMVFPRDRAAPVWGWAKAGATITVSLAGKTATAVAGADGRWQAAIGPIPAGGPHELTIDGPKKVVLGDILVGDVWLFSGQSNMEMGVGGAEGGAEAIATSAQATGIRMLNLGWRLAGTPQPVPPGKVPGWIMPGPTTTGGCSAVAWFTARALQPALQVPVGVVTCAKSGSNIRAWMTDQTLEDLALYREERADLHALAATEAAGGPDVPAQERAMIDAWWHSNDPGTAQGWQNADGGTTATWRDFTIPGAWSDTGAPLDGVVWIRREVDLPPGAADQRARLRLGAIQDEETTFVNGVRVGNTGGWNGPRTHQIPGRILRAGRNLIAIRTLSAAGRGGARGTPGEWSLDIDGQPPVTLAGTWRLGRSAEGSKLPAKPAPRFQGGNGSVTMLYNGGIAAMAPFAFRGAVWYQGEQDAGNQDYYRLLPAMIADWRRAFADPALPMVLVQLPAFHAAVPEPVQKPVWFGLIRDAQLSAARTLDKVGLAVTTDLGDANDVHPKRKREVGERVARAALGVAYGRDDAGGPLFDTAHCLKGEMFIRFTRVHGALEVRPGTPSGFAVAGADGVWHHASARALKDGVVVSSPEVAIPVSVRYGWAENPAVTLYDAAGLPASPFRSDPR